MAVVRTSPSIVGKGSPAAHLAGPARDRSKPQLIVVDDDDDYREITSAELTDCGFDVISFNDGPPLIHYFASGNSADAVVLDWNLSSVMGIDLLPRLRKDESVRNLVNSSRDIPPDAIANSLCCVLPLPKTRPKMGALKGISVSPI